MSTVRKNPICLVCALWLLLPFGLFAQNLLLNPGLEGSTEIASNWGQTVWGTTYPSRVYESETNNTHGGSRAQKITITNLGSSDAGLIFRQNYTFQQAKTYEATFYLRSDDSIVVTFYLRRSGKWYEPGACRTLAVGPNWERVVIQGGFSDTANVPGFIGIVFKTTGTLYLDDASLTELVRQPLQNINIPVPKTLFGIHLNHYGAYTQANWPKLHFGMLRLWDCGTRWRELETAKGIWNWKLMDTLVNNAYAHGQDIIYTMGQTPTWASARPTESASYGAGAAAEPADLQDWRDYIHAVASRYKGKIRYFEIWNEWDQTNFSTISIPKMVELTRLAGEELKAVDSTIQIISPNITTKGFSRLDEYLMQGGASLVDIVAYHDYLSAQPELSYAHQTAIRSICRRYKLDTNPIWNTEGSGGGAGGEQQARGYVCRVFLTQWMEGIGNFNWYCWDIYHPLSLSPDFSSLNTQGQAYQTSVQWLAGARIQSRTISEDGTWLVHLILSSGEPAYLVWNCHDTLRFAVPETWNVIMRRYLNGDSIPGEIDTLSAGAEPVLLIGTSTPSTAKESSTNLSHYQLKILGTSQTEQIKIQFQMVQSGQVSVTLYNISGQSVRTLFHGYKSTGHHTLSVPIHSLPQGIYIVRLKNDRATLATCSIVILR